MGKKTLRCPAHEKGPKRSSQTVKALPSLFFFFSFQYQCQNVHFYSTILRFGAQLSVDINAQHRFGVQLSVNINAHYNIILSRASLLMLNTGLRRLVECIGLRLSPASIVFFFLFSLLFLHLPTPFLA